MPRGGAPRANTHSSPMDDDVVLELDDTRTDEQEHQRDATGLQLTQMTHSDGAILASTEALASPTADADDFEGRQLISRANAKKGKAKKTKTTTTTTKSNAKSKYDSVSVEEDAHRPRHQHDDDDDEEDAEEDHQEEDHRRRLAFSGSLASDEMESTTVSAFSSSSSSAAAASTSASTPASSTSTLMLVISWVSLLIAVFSMAAVGPMFLYLQKRAIPGLLAITWRQIVQVVCLIPPTIIEHWMERKKQREHPDPDHIDWWQMRVNLNTQEEDAAEELKEKQEQQQREQQQQQQQTSSASSSSASDRNLPSLHGGAETPGMSGSPMQVLHVISTPSDGADGEEGDDHDDPSATWNGAAAAAAGPPASSSSAPSSTSSSLSAATSSHPRKKKTRASRNTSSPFVQMVWISACWGCSVSLWVISLPFSSAARASLYSSLYPLMISAYLYFRRSVPISPGEFAGILVCLLGIASSEIMSSIWPDTQTMAAQAALASASAGEGARMGANGTSLVNATLQAILSPATATALPSIIPTSGLTVEQLQVVGDLLCIVGSCFIGANVIAASPTRKVVPLFAFSLLTSIFVLVFICLASMALEGTEFFSMSPTRGVFGFLSSSEMFIRLSLFGFIVGMVGILGFNFSVSYIDPVLFSTVQLLDPGISGVMSAVFGVEGWPVLSTYIGVTIVTIGIFQVVWYQMKREKAATAATAAAARAAADATPTKESTDSEEDVSAADAVANDGARSSTLNVLARQLAEEDDEEEEEKAAAPAADHAVRQKRKQSRKYHQAEMVELSPAASSASASSSTKTNEA